MADADAGLAAGPIRSPAAEGPSGPAPGGDRAGSAWYVVYSKPHKEGTAEFQLRRRSVEVFYPRLQLPAYVDARRQIVPLFPGYLFVRIVLADQFYDVVWAPGVSRFIGNVGQPTPLDDEVVVFLKQHSEPDGLLRARPTLVVGEHVEITRGPFAGIVGIIQTPPNAKGRIRVLMRLLNRRPVHVELPLHFVRTGWTPTSRGSAAPAPTARMRA
jgi:transcription antitermination factor NusG